nr:MAG TPA: hypothetical protein [Bacteriophage sp.]
MPSVTHQKYIGNSSLVSIHWTRLLAYVTVMFVSVSTWLIHDKTSAFCIFLSNFGY